MNSLSKFRRSSWSHIIVLLLLVSGCRSARFTPRSPAPTSHANYSASAREFGTSLEDIDARNRADIAAHLGRPVAHGPATPDEVVAMTRAGVEPRFIISYINRSTGLRPLTTEDLIYLHQQGVNDQVIQAMLTPGAADSRAEVARAMPPRTIILADPCWPDCYCPHYGGFVQYGYGYRCY